MKKIALLILVFSEVFYAHARLAQTGAVVPRDTNPGLKIAPCGNVVRTATPRALTGGQTITINWEETINHPGSYFIEFSQSGDTGWQRLATIPDTQNTAVGAVPHQYTTTVTVPNVNCTACTIRLVQEMTDRNPPTYYYSCGDVTVTAAAAPPTNPTPNPTPVPDEYGGPDNAERESCAGH